MKIPLSNRLQACCNMVRQGDRVADVGCDHGYLGIWLLTQGIASQVIGSDVNEMPLNSAIRNAEKFGVRDKMSFYLSDGVRNIPRDFDVMVCAGMGADTMISILEAAPWLRNPSYRLILQCQSRRPALRQYLSQQGFRIVKESLAKDGKFIYPIMEVIYEPGQSLTPAQCHISPALINSGDPLLDPFFARVREGLLTTVKGLIQAGESTRQAEYESILTQLDAMYKEAHQ